MKSMAQELDEFLEAVLENGLENTPKILRNIHEQIQRRKEIEKQQERTAEKLEDNLLDRLESSLPENYRIENWREEVEERKPESTSPEALGDYELPWQVLGAPGGPYAFYHYFVLDEEADHDVESCKFATAIDYVIGDILVNDHTIEEEVKEFAEEWDELDDAVPPRVGLSSGALENKLAADKKLLEEDLLPYLNKYCFLDSFIVSREEAANSVDTDEIDEFEEAIEVCYFPVKYADNERFVPDYFLVDETGSDMLYRFKEGGYNMAVDVQSKVIAVDDEIYDLPGVEQAVVALKEEWEENSSFEGEVKITKYSKLENTKDWNRKND
ncbi:MAG: hypothetical protein SVV03_03665 [Candidatus Nanohaloarchaea archaeon]|nr:hypothetical protein [Candidatus Nanohaloarchaea archaeon]